MPTATLLLREPAVTSLTSIVEKSQHRKPPLPEYDLRLDSCQLDFVLKSEPEPTAVKLSSTDEGFESDVDTLSIVSSDDSFTSGNLRDNASKIQETDSANGSASSDSDTEAPAAETLSSKVVDDATAAAAVVKSGISNVSNEIYHLVDCMCYTDIKFPNILVFVVKGDALVFRFDNLDNLRSFYTNFSTFKAIANQKIYSNNYGTKFNLLQRTDKNGITHIEITKEPETRLTFPQKCETSNIISLNTPETDASAYYGNCGNLEIKEEVKNNTFKANAISSNNSLHPFNNIHKESRSSLKDANSRQRSESPTLYDAQSRKEFNTKNSHSSKVGLSTSSQRSASTENILDIQEPTTNSRTLENVKHSLTKKVWNSAEDLLDASSPKRPERRRKLKPKAPQPPLENVDSKNTHDVLKGQYVRVNVTSSDIKLAERSFARTNTRDTSSKLQKMLPTKDYSLTLSSRSNKTFQQFRYVEPKRIESTPTNNLRMVNSENTSSSWSYSVPRFLRKPRSQSETRNFTPMAYRYIDTTNKSYYYGNKSDFHLNTTNTNNVSNRLFGMSSKLKDFSNDSTMTKKRYDEWENRCDVRRGSLGELTYKMNSSGGSLKSVIKKDDNKRRSNEKKVTFSAYTTVQVV